MGENGVREQGMASPRGSHWTVRLGFMCPAVNVGSALRAY
jgi:hypothetical protein